MTDPDTKPTDVPTLPEEAEPAPQREKYQLSREVRGWAVGMAALIVAVAAVAPFSTDQDLLGTIGRPLDAVRTVPVAAEEGCVKQDTSSGTGGQNVKCAFTCAELPGTVSVEADATDADASVSGSVNCGGGSAHCSGQNSCEQVGRRKAGGAGVCQASSSEFWDSGLYVSCSAEADGIINDPVPDEWCPVTEPQKVCVQPACAQLDFVARATCQEVWARMVDTLSPTTHKLGYLVDDAGGAGLDCKGFVCAPLGPLKRL